MKLRCMIAVVLAIASIPAFAAGPEIQVVFDTRIKTLNDLYHGEKLEPLESMEDRIVKLLTEKITCRFPYIEWIPVLHGQEIRHDQPRVKVTFEQSSGPDEKKYIHWTGAVPNADPDLSTFPRRTVYAYWEDWEPQDLDLLARDIRHHLELDLQEHGKKIEEGFVKLIRLTDRIELEREWNGFRIPLEWTALRPAPGTLFRVNFETTVSDAAEPGHLFLSSIHQLRDHPEFVRAVFHDCQEYRMVFHPWSTERPYELTPHAECSPEGRPTNGIEAYFAPNLLRQTNVFLESYQRDRYHGPIEYLDEHAGGSTCD